MYDIKVGFTCNNNCWHCVVANKRPTEDLTFEEIKKIVDSVDKEEGITLTGGEVSIRPDFFDIVKYCKDTGHSVQIQTNGTGFANKELCHKVAPYLDSVLIAIHSCEESIHNDIVGCTNKDKSMYQLTIQGFDNLIDEGVFLNTQTVLSSKNIESLYDTYAFLQKKKPGILMHMTYPHPMGSAYTNAEGVVLNFSEINKYIKPCLRDFGEYLLLEAIPLCYVFPYNTNVLYNFDMALKVTPTIRHGFDASLKDLRFVKDYNKNDLGTKYKGPLCDKCGFNNLCVGVWEEYKEFHNKDFDLLPIEHLDERAIDTIKIDMNNSIQYSIKDVLLSEKVSSFKRLELYNLLDSHREEIKELQSSYKWLLPVIEDDSLEEVTTFKYKSFCFKPTSSSLKEIKSISGKSIYLDLDLNKIDEKIFENIKVLSNNNLLFIRIVISKKENKDYDTLLKRVGAFITFFKENNLLFSLVGLPYCASEFVDFSKLNIIEDSDNMSPSIPNLRGKTLFVDRDKIITNYEDTFYYKVDECYNCSKTNLCWGLSSNWEAIPCI